MHLWRSNQKKKYNVRPRCSTHAVSHRPVPSHGASTATDAPTLVLVFLRCRRLLILSATVCVASSFGLSGGASPLLRQSAAAAVVRVPEPVRCAYNPQPSKARPKKSKAPKEKVKARRRPPSSCRSRPSGRAPLHHGDTHSGLSLFTVVGVIPFTASLARQAWTKYKFTNRRIEVASGFQGKDVVQIIWREIADVKWLRRYGGAAGDLVFSLTDGSKLEMRSVPEFDRNLAFVMKQVSEDALEASDYPDKPARDFLAKVESGGGARRAARARRGGAVGDPDTACAHEVARTLLMLYRESPEHGVRRMLGFVVVCMYGEEAFERPPRGPASYGNRCGACDWFCLACASHE